MIQVIKRATDILDHLARHGGAEIADLQKALGLKYITLYKIIGTLVVLGWVRRDGSRYLPGPRLADPNRDERRKAAVAAVAHTYAQALAKRVGEAITISHLHKGAVFTAVKVTHEDELMVSADYFDKYSIYGTASGRILLAFVDEVERQAVVASNGDWRKEWPEAPTPKKLDAELASIRRRRLAVRGGASSPTRAVAVPVFGPDGHVWASLGCLVPLSRFKGLHKKLIIDELRNTAESMAVMIGARIGN